MGGSAVIQLSTAVGFRILSWRSPTLDSKMLVLARFGTFEYRIFS